MSATPSTSAHSMAGRGDIDIVDAQIHIAPQPGPDGLRTAMDALGIHSVVLDELWGRNAQDHGTPCIELGDGAYRPLSPLAQVAALQQPERFAFLQRITRRDPELPRLIPLLAATPGCRSLRIVIADARERELFATGGYDALLSLAQTHELPLSVLTRDAGPLLAAAARRFPDLQFIVDHCGWVRTQPQWDDVLALARLPNIWLKWSHAHRAFGGGADAADSVQRAFVGAIAAFGAPRVLWAGDVTHEESRASWAQLLAFVQYNPALSQTQREWVLGGTARAVLRWPATRS